MSLHASKSDLLNAFNFTAIVELKERKTRHFMRQSLCLNKIYNYIELADSLII